MAIIRTVVTSSLVAAVVTVISGCVTTQSLSVEQCQSGNWEDIGYTDGIMGRSGAYFGNHVDQCAAVATNAPNRQLWEQGRQEGLKEFCTELIAYKLGREGYAWQPVCPLDNIEKLEEAYQQGRYYYLRQRDLDYLDRPYPWGYTPYWRHPFWYPYW